MNDDVKLTRVQLLSVSCAGSEYLPGRISM